MNTLKDHLPHEFMGGEYTDTRAYTLRDVEVKEKHDGCARGHGWPGPQVHVMFWYELVNGLAVGFNENPGRGWSFPVIRMK